MSGMAKPEWPDASIPELVEWRGKVVAVPKTGSEIRRQGMWSQPIDSGGLEKVSRAAERFRFVRSPGPVSLRGRFKRFAWVGLAGARHSASFGRSSSLPSPVSSISFRIRQKSV